MRPRTKKYFTLLEVMVSLAVFALVIVAAGALFVTTNKSWQRQRGVLDCVQNVRWAQEFMINELRHGAVTGMPGWVRLQVAAGGERIDFGVDTDGNLLPDTHVWYWRGNAGGLGDADKIYRGIGNGIGQANANRQEVANLIVTNPSGNDLFSLSGGLLTIEMTVRPYPDTAAGSGNQDYTVESRVRVRN